MSQFCLFLLLFRKSNWAFYVLVMGSVSAACKVTKSEISPWAHFHPLSTSLGASVASWWEGRWMSLVVYSESMQEKRLGAVHSLPPPLPSSLPLQMLFLSGLIQTDKIVRHMHGKQCLFRAWLESMCFSRGIADIRWIYISSGVVLFHVAPGEASAHICRVQSIPRCLVIFSRAA